MSDKCYGGKKVQVKNTGNARQDERMIYFK